MLTNKYLKSFLNDSNDEVEIGFILNKVIKFEKIIEKSVLDWNQKDISNYLKSYKAISPSSLNKYASVVRRFVEYICEKENCNIENFDTEKLNMENLIDIKGILNLTLNYSQYMNIKNQLSKMDGAEELNVRDKLMFELAWSSLTNEEIKMLKNDMIKFSKNDEGENIAILFLNTRRIVRIEDFEIVEDIRKCMKEMYYVVTTKNNVYKRMSYRSSEYLVKPVNVGKGKKEDFLNNPGDTLHKIFKNNDISCEGIDVDNLTMEDIRRSKIVYMLTPENREYFDDETILGLFNLKSKQSLVWYKNLANIKHGVI